MSRRGKRRSRQERRESRKQFRTAQAREIREHKSSYVVFRVLEVLVIAVMIRQGMLGNYESMFFCLATLLLLYIPSWLQVRFRIDLPPLLESIILCFIFAAEILGEVGAFYVAVPGWDTALHTLNGFLCAAIGFSLVVLLNDDERLTFTLSPFFLALTGFCFSMTIGVLWEFFEFSMDLFLHTDMQKDTIIHAIHSVTLDLTRTNTVVHIPDIHTTAVNGTELGLGGYLDIGLNDTMKDLFVNFLGAVVFSLIGYLYARSKGTRHAEAKRLIPVRRSGGETK